MVPLNLLTLFVKLSNPLHINLEKKLSTLERLGEVEWPKNVGKEKGGEWDSALLGLQVSSYFIFSKAKGGNYSYRFVFCARKIMLNSNW